MGKLKIIMSSDPQFPWTAQDDKVFKEQYTIEGTTKNFPYEKDGRLYAEYQTKSMKKLISEQEIRAIVVNGDLTAHHALNSDDLIGFKEFYGDFSVPMYIALGNHDYDKLLHKTFEERGPSDMVEFMYDHLETEQMKNTVLNRHFLKLEGKGKKPTVEYVGSMSYTFDIDNIRFIQLQNNPPYEAEWESYRSDKNKYFKFNIIGSINWLEKELAKARNEGKVIIVCMHHPLGYCGDDAVTNRKFCDMIALYGVSAVFVGHMHQRLGYDCEYNTVPCFVCGAASQCSYLMLEFDDEKLTVNSVRSQNGQVNFKESRTVLLRSGVPEKPFSIPQTERFIIVSNDTDYKVESLLEYRFATGEIGTEFVEKIPSGAKTLYILPAGSSPMRLSVNKKKFLSKKSILNLLNEAVECDCCYELSENGFKLNYEYSKKWN